MGKNAWQERISRAEALAHDYPFAAEILNFYCIVAGFQEGLFRRIEAASSTSKAATRRPPIKPSSSVIASEAELPLFFGNSAQSRDLAFSAPPIVAGPPELSTLLASFPEFLALVEKHGPINLAEAAFQLRSTSNEVQIQLLNDFWDSPPASSDNSDANDSNTSAPPAHEFFARAFLQPYAVFVRARSDGSSNGYTGSLCPFCGRKPGVAVLRPLGDGGQRRLVCSFCLEEWDFRRIVCASCGEEDHKNLPVYTADRFPHVRVDCCDRCRRYLKTVDLTKTGLADPIVDELATIPLDLWARERGYEKLHLNLLQL